MRNSHGNTTARARSSRGRRPGGGRVILILLLVLCAAGATAAGLALYNRRQTLDGARVGQQTYTDASGLAGVTQTEQQRYYSLSVQRPDAASAPVSGAMTADIDGMCERFRAGLDTLLQDKKLNSDDPAKLDVRCESLVFENYVTYTVTSDYYLYDGCGDNGVSVTRFIVNADDNTALDTGTVFADNYDYRAALSLRLAQAAGSGDVKSLSDLIAADTALFDNGLSLTEDGLTFTFDEAVGTDIAAGTALTVSYTDVYRSLAITLPERYKPAEPTPIDPTVEKVVALTFDDGPYAKVTNQLLALLDQYNAKATFFVAGYKVDDYPEVVKDAYSRGHEIAVHSTDHKSLTKMTDDQILADIRGMQDKLEALIGVRPSLMRPVGGAVNQHIAELLDMPVIIWDCDPQDWKYHDAQKISDYVLKNVKSGDIVLSHDLYQTTYDAYAIIIPALAEQGYRFVTVSELIGYTDGAYAGKIIYNRSLVKELRAAGAFD